MSSEIRPLAAPGAGLPPVEAWLLKRILFPLARRATAEESIVKFVAEGRQILERVRSLTPEQQRKRMRIPRLIALEDSSREWSALMVVEHLLITGPGMLGIARALSSGIVPQRELQIAKLKPKGESGPGILEDFERLLDGYPAEVAALGWPEQPTFPHPWFGELDARGWVVLNGFHQWIHRRQVEQVADQV